MQKEQLVTTGALAENHFEACYKGTKFQDTLDLAYFDGSVDHVAIDSGDSKRAHSTRLDVENRMQVSKIAQTRPGKRDIFKKPHFSRRSHFAMHGGVL